MSDYPECEKLHAVSDVSQKIGEFLEWLKNRYVLCQWRESYREEWIDVGGQKVSLSVPEGYYPENQSIQTILADYFEIDMNKVEEECREILKSLQERN